MPGEFYSKYLSYQIILVTLISKYNLSVRCMWSASILSVFIDNENLRVILSRELEAIVSTNVQERACARE